MTRPGAGPPSPASARLDGDRRVLERFDHAWDASRLSLATRAERLRQKSFHVAQSAAAAGVAWWFATDVAHHRLAFFAPVVAVICLGMGYGQRLRRVAEVTVGVAIGVLVADLFIHVAGSGPWQVTAVVVVSMSIALLLDAGALLVTQAAVQSVVVATLVAPPGVALTRWLDALIGGGTALIAATVVPQAPLRRPRVVASAVVRTNATLLRATARSARTGDVDEAVEVLAEARSTDGLIRELQAAADEGLSVVASSPFRRGHRAHVRRISDLVIPIDRAIRSTRVLTRRVSVAVARGESLPASYLALLDQLADAADVCADALAADRSPAAGRRDLEDVGWASSRLERTDLLSAEVVLAQLRAITADLLQMTGLDDAEAVERIPRERGH